jgi:aldose 1-epimerase
MIARGTLALLASNVLVLAAPVQAMTESEFGVMPDGQVVRQYRLTNARGTEADILSLGATLRTLKVRDRNGRSIDVVLGYDTLQEYLDGRGYFGATVGRYANRIANAAFTLEGRTHRLAQNNGSHALHGGVRGFNRVLWEQDGTGGRGGDSVRLKYVSADGEEGYPGRLTVWVTYLLSADNALKIRYEATTSATTVINLTNHSYFNLGGAGEGDVLAQRLEVKADGYTPVGADSIPTGDVAPVQGTDFDFRAGAVLGERIQAARDERVVKARGYDINLVLRRRGAGLQYAASLREPRTGIEMQVYTSEPGLQLFTANFAAGRRGKDGKTYMGAAAVCLETQHFPNSPNVAHFPGTVLAPGATFRSETVYRLRSR